MPKIDAESYSNGRAAFNFGSSLRDTIEKMPDADPDEGMSAMLGFLDAALDKLRGIER
jgi:hypothetical protein